MVQLSIQDLTCPYINKEKAAIFETQYYCDFDHMEFDSMRAHCIGCDMYRNMIKRAGAKLREG